MSRTASARMLQLIVAAIAFYYAAIAVPAFAREEGGDYCDGNRSLHKINKFRNDPGFPAECFAIAKALLVTASGNDTNLAVAEGVIDTIASAWPSSPYVFMGAAELILRKHELNAGNDSLSDAYHDAKLATLAKPTIPDAFITLGRVEYLIGCFVCSEKTLKKALSMGSVGLDSVLLAAKLAEVRGELVEAKSLLNGAIVSTNNQVTPDVEVSIHLELSKILVREGGNKEAQLEIRKAIDMAPRDYRPRLDNAEFQLFVLHDPVAAIDAVAESEQVQTTIEARQVDALAKYVSWAEKYPKTSTAQDVKGIAASTYMLPDEALLHSAKYPALIELTKALLKARSVRGMEVRDGLGNTPLIISSIGNNDATARLLLSKGSDINASNGSGERALTFFISNGNQKATDLFLQSGANVDYVDANGNSPLSLALWRKDIKLAKKLIEKGAPVGPVADLAKKLGVQEVLESIQPDALGRI